MPKLNTNKKRTTSAKSTPRRAQSSQKNKVLLAIVGVLIFAALGAAIIRNSSAATTFYTSFWAAGCNGTPTVAVGSRGQCVLAVQRALNNWTRNTNASDGKNNSPNKVLLAEDGIFGEATKNKVLDFQRAKNIQGKNTAPDGIVGPATWAALLNDCNATGSCPKVVSGGK